MIHILHGIFGLVVLTLFSFLLSENRSKVMARQVAGGLIVQLTLALILLKVPYSADFFKILNRLVLSLQEATDAGSSFVFGYLGGASLPFIETTPGSSFILAFRALPIILVISALSSLLFYWRIMPFLVNSIARMLQRSMGIGGALGIGAAANIFVGMVEAPLFIRPYLNRMSKSELFAIMTCGMATIAGTVMVLYATIIQSSVPGAMGHILIASIISAPAALTVSRIMVPESDQATDGEIIAPNTATSSMDAVTKGTLDGIQILINIVAMLVVIVALVSLLNQVLSIIPDIAGEPLTLQRLLGYLLSPITWLIGIPWHEAVPAASLLGTKTVFNEFLAYLYLSSLPPGTLSERSTMIMLYALCGFANFGSLGIMLGGLGSMAPDRRSQIVSLGLKSIIAGTISTCMTGAVVGMII